MNDVEQGIRNKWELYQPLEIEHVEGLQGKGGGTFLYCV